MGRIGESIALDYLIKNGHSLIIKNYSCKTGEIDIITSLGEMIVFTEVKTRTSIEFGYPSESITRNKIGKIITTAKIYMQKNNIKKQGIRFDAVTVLINSKNVYYLLKEFSKNNSIRKYRAPEYFHIEHLEDAFQSGINT